MMAQQRKSGFALVALASLLALAVAGCGDEDRPGVWAGTGGGDRPLPGQPCADGETRSCHITLNERNGVLTCYNGTQVCADGRWGECGDGTLSEQSAPAWFVAGALQPLQTAPSSCHPDNPCDPSCQQLDDNDPLVPDSTMMPGSGGGSSGYDWQWGSLAAFPPGLVKKGIREPCSSSWDCQFNMYCNGPKQGSCAHSVCTTGVTLTSGCENAAHDCTELICAVDGTCCGATSSSCNHDPCQTGTALTSGCNNCVTQICDAMPSCCSTSWTQACVDAVATICGNTCSCPSDWSAYGDSCYRMYTGGSNSVRWTEARTKCQSATTGGHLAIINDAGEQAFVASLGGEMWIGLEGLAGGWTWVDGVVLSSPQYFDVSPDNGVVDTAAPAVDTSRAVYIGGDDLWNYGPKNANPKRNYVCESSSNRKMSSTWNASCVEMVATVCHAFCDDPVTGEPNTGQGECVPYNAGFVDPNCPGVNLTVAPTCYDGTSYIVPVCNHGQSTLSASPANPVRIVSYQGNSSHFPSATPGVGNGDKVQDTCYLEEDIPPGECVMVGGCDLDNNGAVIVNPQTPGLTNPAPRTECDYGDNWSLVKKKTSNACQDVPCGQFDGYYDDLTTGSCVAAVPPQQQYENPALVTITHVYDASSVDDDLEPPLEFTYVTSAANCSSASGGLGWYYDNASNPSTFHLCPNACTRVKNTATYNNGSEVYVSAACGGGEPTTVFEQTIYYFTYEGECSFDRGAQWQDLGYVADIPPGSTIEWYVATSNDPDALPSEPVDLSDPAWRLAGTSDETVPNCPTNSSPDCSIDVFNALGGLPDAQLEHIAVAIVLNPTGDGSAAPTVTSFNVTYSCPFNQ